MQKHAQPIPAPHTLPQQPSVVSVQPPQVLQVVPAQHMYQVQVVSTPPKDAWDKTATSINVLLGIVGIVSIAIAVKALRKVGEQIRVAEKDTQAMIRAERAWLVIDVKQPRPGEYLFYLKNTGKTPARVVSIWVKNFWVPREQEVVLPTNEESRESLLSTPPKMIPAGSIHPLWYCTRAEFQQMSGGGPGEQSRFERGFGAALMYGRVRYFDVLSDEAEVPHETRWTYWLIPQPGTKPSVYPFGFGTEHNTYT